MERVQKKRVVVAMSGGVDSTVTALLLKKKGYEVVGISMQLWDHSLEDEVSFGSCCSLEDIYEARRVADSFGFPFYVVNLEEQFTKSVVDYFVTSYLEGETPNPCLKCNEILKFKVLLKKARELGADFLATGHYARLFYDHESERYRLLKGKDIWKDQSYFLFTLTQDQLKSILFPLGEFTKDEVRAMAREWGLRVADKKDSQEICFIPENDYGDFISKKTGIDSHGDIVDMAGKVIGEHSGLFRYTVGQRRGLKLSAGNPMYVLRLDHQNNRLIVGENEELLSKGLVANGLNWIGFSSLDSSMIMDSKIRYRHPGTRSTVIPSKAKDEVEVHFVEEQKAVTPGQAVVFYQGDEVMGGGWIKASI